jgi:hypothetical protein
MHSDARFWDKRAEKYSQRPVGDQDAAGFAVVAAVDILQCTAFGVV